MILGAIAGDVIGSIYEWENTKDRDFPLFSEGSTFTDDSVMTLAVALALLNAYVDHEQPISYALVESMRALGRSFPHAGYGGRFAKWLRAGVPHPRPYKSFGNGSGMRVSPAAWAFNTLAEVELRAAATSSKVMVFVPSW